MLTSTWFNTKTRFFDSDENTYKAIVPINFFEDMSLNGHFGIEFKVINNKATVVITELEDNPGVDVNIVINLICMSIYENFIKFFEVEPENIFWVVNKPNAKQEINIANVIFEKCIPVTMSGQELMTFYNPAWSEIGSFKKFIAMSQLHLYIDENPFF